jgi:hypothetical protein
MEASNYFVRYLMAPIILSIGLVGETIGLLILQRKNIKNIGPKSMYRYLFIMDMSYLSLIIVNYLDYGFDYDLTITSKYFCKLYWYLNFVLGPISPYLLIYISIEKLISIKYPTKKYFLRRKETQLIYFIGILAFNFVFYLPIAYVFKIEYQIEDNITIINCNAPDYTFFAIINFMDLVNRLAIPIIIMTVNTYFMVNSIHRLRQRVSDHFNVDNHNNFRQKIFILFSLVFMNISYVIFELPLSIIAFIIILQGDIFYYFLYFGYFGYAYNSIIIIITDPSFRKELLSFIR